MKHIDDWIVLFALLVLVCTAAAIRYDDTQKWRQFKEVCEGIRGAQAIRTGTYYYQCVPTIAGIKSEESEE